MESPHLAGEKRKKQREVERLHAGGKAFPHSLSSWRGGKGNGIITTSKIERGKTELLALDVSKALILTKKRGGGEGKLHTSFSP